MGGFDADGAALAAASHDVRSAAGRLHEERAQLDALVAGFLGHDWTGPAAVTRVNYEHSDDGSSAAAHRVAARLVERLG